MLFSQLREGDFVTSIILMRSIQKTDESLQKKHLTFLVQQSVILGLLKIQNEKVSCRITLN